VLAIVRMLRRAPNGVSGAQTNVTVRPPYCDLLLRIRELEKTVVASCGGMNGTWSGSADTRVTLLRELQALDNGSHLNIRQRATLMSYVVEGGRYGRPDTPNRAWEHGLGAFDFTGVPVQLELTNSTHRFDAAIRGAHIWSPAHYRLFYVSAGRGKDALNDAIEINSYGDQVLEIRPDDVRLVRVEIHHKPQVEVVFDLLFARRVNLAGDGPWSGTLHFFITSLEAWRPIDALMFRLDCGASDASAPEYKPVAVHSAPGA